jgi:sulfatase modifying factor 1
MFSRRVGVALPPVFQGGQQMSLRRMTAVSVLPVGLILIGAAAPVMALPDYPGDVDGDGDVDLSDLAGLLGAYDTCEGDPFYNPAADFDDSGCIDLTDLATLLAYYGTSAPPPDMILVPAGEFEMGDCFEEGGTDEQPVHTVYLSAYFIDTSEVTNQQYCDALNWAWAQGGLITVSPGGIVYQCGSGTDYPYCDTTNITSYSRITWDGATFGVVSGKENHPMARVSWYGSVAFCNWRSAMEGKPLCYDLSEWTCNFGAAGYRLPTEAEWEKAAGWDPAQQYHFRFAEHTDGCGSNCLDGQRANYLDSGAPFQAGDYPWTTPVGFYNGELHYKVDFDWPGSETSYQTQDARSYYGCYGLSGNVQEWCHDWYSDTYYSSSPGSNPTGPATGVYRVLRGNSWLGQPSGCRSAWRHRSTPVNRNHTYGFRCAAGTP